MRYKIVIDSCGELLNEWKDDERFESVPLTLMVGADQIIDDETFDQLSFLKKVADYPECPKSYHTDSAYAYEQKKHIRTHLSY